MSPLVLFLALCILAFIMTIIDYASETHNASIGYIELAMTGAFAIILIIFTAILLLKI